MNDLENYVLFGKLKLKGKKVNYIKEDCVFSINDKYYKKEEIIEIIEFKKIGTKNKTKDFTQVKASNEKRNNITGAYE
jgi:hypothetical protein